MITINSKRTVKVLGIIRLVQFSKFDAQIYNYTFKVSNFYNQLIFYKVISNANSRRSHNR